MVPQSHRRVMLNRGRTAAPVSACVTRCIERKNKSLRIFLISDQHFKNVGCLSLKCKKKKKPDLNITVIFPSGLHASVITSIEFLATLCSLSYFYPYLNNHNRQFIYVYYIYVYVLLSL